MLGKYPDLLYAPLEIKGDAEVHALSRCQMILTEAKKRAAREFDEVLNRTGLTVEKLKESRRNEPDAERATSACRGTACRELRPTSRCTSPAGPPC